MKKTETPVSSLLIEVAVYGVVTERFALVTGSASYLTGSEWHLVREWLRRITSRPVGSPAEAAETVADEPALVEGGH